MAAILKCRSLVTGQGSGEVMTTIQSISFWGGVDPATGKIIDPRHECFGQVVTGKVLAFPHGKGSAAAPLVLLELVKQGTAPAAIVNVDTDPLLAAGSIIGKHFYGTSFPVVALSWDDFHLLQTGAHADVDGIRGQIALTGRLSY